MLDLDHLTLGAVMLLVIVAFLLVLPPRFDPAIRIKEWLAPERTTLIRFDCRGCMAEDWREADRGEIVGKVFRNVPDGSRDGARTGYYVVQREDGSTFEAVMMNCQPGTAEMQPRTDNPGEPLAGKIVCLE